MGKDSAGAGIVTFHGRVERGQILIDREAFSQQLALLEGKAIELSLRRERRRPAAQNYYWAVVLRIFASRLGCELDELHEALKREFLTIDASARLAITRSIGDLSTVEFSRYLDQVLGLAAEMGVAIEEPVPAFIRSA